MNFLRQSLLRSWTDRSEKMAQRVVFFLLWLFDRSFAGFPNQINIGKCFVVTRLQFLWFLFLTDIWTARLRFKEDTARGALRNDKRPTWFLICCRLKSTEFKKYIKATTDCVTVIVRVFIKHKIYVTLAVHLRCPKSYREARGLKKNKHKKIVFF